MIINFPILIKSNFFKRKLCERFRFLIERFQCLFYRNNNDVIGVLLSENNIDKIIISNELN